MKRVVAVSVSAILISAAISACGGSHHSKPPTTTSAAAQTPRTTAVTVAKSYVAPVSTVQLAPSVAKYAVYVDGLLGSLRVQVARLHAAAGSGSLAVSEADWIEARSTYLEIGQDDDAYGAFGALGEQIDGLADGLAHTTRNHDFTGFHRIELDLWRRHNLAEATRDSAQLMTFVHRLTPTLVQRDLPLTALGVDNWVLRCHEILEDALRDSLTENDDYGSNSDLASLAADVKATHEMLNVLAPLIETRAPRLVPTATVDLRTLSAAIAAAGGPSANRNLRTLPPRERQALDAATSAATETLAPVSEIMQVAVPGS